MQELEKLNIYSSDIRNLPSSVGQLQHLKHLEVSNCDLDAFPSQLQMLDSLETLDLRKTGIARIPTGFHEDFPLLKELNLSYCGALQVEHIIEALKPMEQLEKLIYMQYQMPEEHRKMLQQELPNLRLQY